MNTYFNKDIFPQNQYKEEQEPIKYNYNPNIQEQPYLENILKLNRGKKLKIYMSYPYSNETKEYKGILENSGKDYITISEPQTGNWHLLPLPFINYITFDENINYSQEYWFKHQNLL